MAAVEFRVGRGHQAVTEDRGHRAGQATAAAQVDVDIDRARRAGPQRQGLGRQ